MAVIVLIPVLDPTETTLELAREIKTHHLNNIVMVDDGSNVSGELFFSLMEKEGVTVLHHERNLGKGAAIKTALTYVMGLPDLLGIDGIVTADADGQHRPSDIRKIADKLMETHHLVMGKRNFKAKRVPRRSRLGNSFSSFFYHLETGGICTDTQTGLRGIPKALFNLALETPGERYEYEMNFLLSVGKAGYAIEMEDIETVYEKGNMVSHFRPVADSYRIYQTMFNYVFASLACAFVDLGLFHIFTLVIDKSTGRMLLEATISARVISGVVNFLLNKFFSFKKKKRTVSQFFKYGVLFIFQMTSSWLLVWFLSGIGVAYVFIKAVVDTILFCLSYYVQRTWVFRNEIS